VINQKAKSNKIIGVNVPYTINKGKIKVKVLLETEKQRITVVSSQNAKGEVISDLPKGGVFVPAIFKKTQKNDRNIKILVLYAP